ncbi:MAG: DUF1553 domain-containing protein [Verrucomicrobiales bacterium]
MRFIVPAFAPAVIAFAALPAAAAESEITPEQMAFFENKVRPVLAERCYDCHSAGAEKLKAGFYADSRDGMLQGGDTGPAVVPGDPEASLLIEVVRYGNVDLQMPPKAKLPDDQIAALEEWVKMGAPWPGGGAASPAAKKEKFDLAGRKAEHWSWAPVSHAEPPAVKDAGWVKDPADRFILAKLEEKGMEPNGPAEPRTLVRRLYFDLTGLPPTPEQADAFAAAYAKSPAAAIEATADQLLESPRFGERWARHWMDWVRYAESHGSEGDPAIPHAWRYRDYLIRALNADVPYDRLVREHLAGDLLDPPRLNAELGINESALGPAQLRFTFHGFAPTDALDELVRFTDEQIDVTTKAFLGVTVSCARCHHHKFDPISQDDFYALFGVFASARPAMQTIDSPERANAHREELAKLKGEIRKALARGWGDVADAAGGRLAEPDGGLEKAIGSAGESSPLFPWRELRGKSGTDFTSAFKALRQRFEQSGKELAARKAKSLDLAASAVVGNGVSLEQVGKAGAFRVLPAGDQWIDGPLPGGVHSGLLSDKHSAWFGSPRFLTDGAPVWVRAAGEGDAMLRYVVQNYPRNGTVYPVNNLKGGAESWRRLDLNYWAGDQIHVELSAARDQPVLAKGNARSWFSVSDIAIVPEGEPAPKDEPAESWAPLFAGPDPEDAAALAGRYASALAASAKAWDEGTLDDAGARFLTGLIEVGLLPASMPKGSDAKLFEPVEALVRRYREIEAQVPEPIRAPGVAEGPGYDQALFVRGDHQQPADPVPRRFLEVFGGEPFAPQGSGRLELAEAIFRPENTLPARVIANRIWHHVFGRGIVATPDNFGRLGEKPTHPELLDFLAQRIEREGWSLKSAIRFAVTSRAFRLSSAPPPDAAQSDPGNALLSHFPVRRLEAEAIRDAILATSGGLDVAMFGEPAGDSAPRRSVYLRVVRNDLNPFLAAFDAPEPHTTKGNRDATNVPAQSLALLNDPFVIGEASRWAKAVLADPSLPDEAARLAAMFQRALGRPATGDEIAAARGFLAELRAKGNGVREAAEANRADLAEAEAKVAALLDPVRERLARERGGGKAVPKNLPAPVASWEFDDLGDRLGKLDLELRGGAKLEGGALALHGGFAATKPLAADLRARTLEAWVQLDTLDQEGGGAITVQTLDGNVFDSVVFAERQPRRWMAGSNFFKRTQDFAGAPEESAAVGQPVQIAIAWHEDGTVAAYRNGAPYGQPYKAEPAIGFAAGQAQIVFGLRHGTGAAGNRLLRGKILRAQLYDRALSENEIAASASASGIVAIPEADVIAALGEGGQASHAGLAMRIEALRQRAADLAKAADYEPSEARVWQDLAQSIFNLKEFIYLR